MVSVYRRVRHAAHYARGGGHDLEQWIVAGDQPVKPADVPADAELAHGQRGPDLVQRWTWQRSAPMSEGRCHACPGGSR